MQSLLLVTLELLEHCIGFYWPNNKIDIIKWCEKCAICQINNLVTTHPKAQMKHYFVGAPMERVAMDLFGPLLRAKTGKLLNTSC